MVDFPGLEFSDVDGKLKVRSQLVAEDRPQLDAALLKDLLGQAGFGDWFLLEEAVASLIARCNAIPEEFEMTLGERRDGGFAFKVSDDGLTAELDVTPAYGGKPVRPEEIIAALKDAGVVFGLSVTAIQRACAATEPSHVIAAQGIAVQNGEDTRFEVLVDLVQERVPHVGEDGLIDFRDLGDIPVVEAGVELMRRVPATDGVAGRDVRGTALQAKAGRDKPFAKKLDGTVPSPQDPNLLCSAIKGQPVSVGDGVFVEPILSIKEVNMESGNITYDGSVKILGDVMSGMKVTATGDISVAGVIEGGELEAGGNIKVGAGIIGHAKVRAPKGSVAARFVENSSIYAGTVIAIDDAVLQSELQSLNQIDIGLKSPQRGRLVGGSTQAVMRVRTPQLGAANSGLTSVKFMPNPVLVERLAELEELIVKQNATQERFKKLVAHLTKHGDPNHMLEHAKASWKQALAVWGQSLKEKVALEEEIARLRGARLEVAVGVAGTVEVAFGKKVRRLQKNYDAGAFSSDEEGRVVFTDPAGHVFVLT